MPFVLPPREQVGVLDPEIAGEGEKVIYSDGRQVAWNPPPIRPVLPDWSQIKSIRHYFNRTNLPTWPAWLYHPTEEPRLVRNAQEAAELGVCYREATFDERGRYNVTHVWDYREDSPWRAVPYHAPKFDPTRPTQGKNYIPSADPLARQQDMVTAISAAVAAAVAQALKAAGSAPAKSLDAEQIATQAVSSLLAEPTPQAPPAMDERALWLEEAERRGVKVNKRWSLAQLKDAVEKAAA